MVQLCRLLLEEGVPSQACWMCGTVIAEVGNDVEMVAVGQRAAFAAVNSAATSARGSGKTNRVTNASRSLTVGRWTY
jgi:hypothetical protein